MVLEVLVELAPLANDALEDNVFVIVVAQVSNVDLTDVEPLVVNV